MAHILVQHDAEELLLQELRRRVAAAQRDERACRARARLMDAVRHALLARAGLALDEHMMLVAGDARRLFAHALERRAAADHRLQAVFRRVARRMRDERPKILDRHRDDDDRLHRLLLVALERYDRRDVLIRLRGRDPRDLLVIGRHAAKALVDRRMLVVQDHVVEVEAAARLMLLLRADAREPLLAELVRIGDLAARQHMVDRERRRVEDGLLRLDAHRLRQMRLERRLHREQQGDHGILRQLDLLHRDERDEILAFPVDLHGRRAGVAELALLHPHLRAEHPERCLMLIGHADARRADLLDADARALDLARRHLVERQAVALEHDAVRVDEQEREIVLLEELADSLAELHEIGDGVLVLRLQAMELLR